MLVLHHLFSIIVFAETDVLEEAFDNYINASEIEKQSDLPFLEGMDDMNVEELETMVLERYKPTSSLIIYAEDVHQTKHYFEPNPVIPSLEKSIRSLDDPIIWKVKCTVILFCITSPLDSLRFGFPLLFWSCILFFDIIYIVGWTREAFSCLPNAKVRRPSGFGNKSKDNFCIRG